MSGLPSPVLKALEFEKANLVKGSVFDDPFYRCPPDRSQAAPGTLLAVEEYVDPVPYLIPAGTALSRILYQSRRLDESLVPVSGYVLWPYAARSQPDGYPVVAWAHATSGVDANIAPSNHKNLWQHFLGPYQLALQGYVVVATDYAGLGVAETASGEPIVHEYLASPSQANDVVYSVRAAQVAFPELSKTFVVIGHSQGGGAAWAVAQREARTPMTGYLGAIAISPYTNFLNEEGISSPVMGAAMCRGIASSFPDFDPGEILTPEGERRVALAFLHGAGAAAAMTLLSRTQLVKSNWKQNPHIQRHAYLTGNGGKAIKGPLLVIHGESDMVNSCAAVQIAVEKTAEAFPLSQLECIWLPCVRHGAALGASQRLWMDWIADRFAGVEVKPGYQASQLTSARPAEVYQSDQTWFLEAASQFYHTP
ncbi:MAG: hypothetical protein LQ342_002286 [Letrouitia transgressa]|nr:MAG: hypothetical protein LQ342_002286 [Letrouitia transgressa]